MARMIVLLFLNGTLRSFGHPQSGTNTIDSITAAVFKLSLADQFSYRNLPSFRGNVETKHPDVILLDSNLVRGQLPKLSIGKFVLLSSRAIERKASVEGIVWFTRLGQLEKINRDSVVVSWEKVECYFSQRWSKIVYRVNLIETRGYHHSAAGWKFGSGRTENIDFLKEE